MRLDETGSVRACCHCKLPGGTGKRELRPYGPGGADVCFECAIGEKSTPERTREAERRLGLALSQPGPLMLDAREQAGPRPAKAEEV